MDPQTEWDIKTSVQTMGILAERISSSVCPLSLQQPIHPWNRTKRTLHTDVSAVASDNTVMAVLGEANDPGYCDGEPHSSASETERFYTPAHVCYRQTLDGRV